MPSNDTLIEHTHADLAALGCLPESSLGDYARGTLADELWYIPHGRLRDSTSMMALDALAAICVAEPGDAYAVTHEMTDSEYVLFVASSSGKEIPPAVLLHLQHVFTSMKSIVAHRDPERSPTALSSFHAQLLHDLYRFSWPALRHRFTLTVDVAIQALGNALYGECKESERTTSAEDCEYQYFHDLLSSLSTLRKLVLDDGLDNGPPIKLHVELLKLKCFLERDGASRMLQCLDGPGEFCVWFT